MDIRKIDKNFDNVSVSSDGMVRYSIPNENFDLYGVFHDGERFLRMPADIAEKTSSGVAWLNTNTSGGRIRFTTDSEKIEIAATYPKIVQMTNMALTGSCGFVLIDETNPEKPVHARTYKPANYDEAQGFTQCIAVNPSCEMRSYTLFMPLYNPVDTLTIGICDGANLEHGRKYRDIKPILYYGSSITQGGCSSRPDTCYTSLISSWSNTDFIDLGFSGNGRAEQVMADYLSTIDCSVFVCDYDHNAPNAEYLEKTHHNLYETFRKKQKNTPIIFLSKPDIEHDPNVEKRFKVIEKTYLTAQKNGDKNVYLIKGYELFDSNIERHLCTVDGTHPNDTGFYLMAKRIYKTLKEIIK